MTDVDDRNYYLARAAMSRQCAARATTSMAAAIHGELADRYDQLAEGLRFKARVSPDAVADADSFHRIRQSAQA